MNVAALFINSTGWGQEIKNTLDLVYILSFKTKAHRNYNPHLLIGLPGYEINRVWVQF